MENRRMPQLSYPPASKRAEALVGAGEEAFSGVSLVELLRLRSAVQPLDVAYTFLRDGEEESDLITYETLDRRSQAIAARLQARCRRGDRVLLLYAPGLEFISAFFGCLYAGMVAVPAYPPNLTRADRAIPRLRAIATDARPIAVLSTRQLIDDLARSADAGTDLHSISAENHAAPSRDRAVEWVATDAIDEGEANGWCDPHADRGTLAFLQYTSGSTSTPKGVMITHGNLLHNLAYAFHLGEDDRSRVSVSWLPVVHDMGLIEGVLQPAFSGRPAYLMSPNAFLQRPVRWLNAIARYGATRSGGPNFAYDLCVARIGPDERRNLDLTTWRSAYCGAEPIRYHTLRAFTNAFSSAGFSSSAFRPCFGLAEATLLVTAGRWSHSCSAPDPEVSPATAIDPHDETVSPPRVSCGTAAFGTRILVVDPEAGRACESGCVGEIWVAGPSVAQGYWNQSKETAHTFRARTDRAEGPFLRTGDLGFIRDGNLYVTGRLKDVLIVRGSKHYPQDLEQTAEQHPAIRPGCTAAFAIEAGSHGDRIAVVAEADVRQLDTPESAQAAIASIRRSVADVHGVLLEAVALAAPGALPKTTSGKLQRFACREAYLRNCLSILAIWRESAPKGEAAPKENLCA